MPKYEDLTGQVFGRWTVLGRAPNRINPNGQTVVMWDTICTDGVAGQVSTSNLTHQKSTSCGCHRKEVSANLTKTHGLSNHPLNSIWAAMRDRCSRQTNSSFHSYGGRGITVCQEWQEDFMNFYNWSISKGWKPGLTLDRRNNDEGYSPDNCQFVTPSRNARNMRKTIIVSMFNESVPALDAFERHTTGRVECITFMNRLRAGWDVYDALYTPKLVGGWKPRV
jgi:hypothetical protein